MLDRWGREIDYLRLSVTDRCSFRCIYCMPESGVPLLEHDRILTIDEMSRVAAVLVRDQGIRKIRVTGGEPLVRKGVVSLVEELAGLNLEDLTMTTNGTLLAQRAADLSAAGLDRINVSLDSLRNQTLRLITRRRAALEDIEGGIDAALAAGLSPVKVNCVVIGGLNDREIPDFISWGSDRSLEVRFIEHMPTILPADRFVSAEEILRRASALGPIEQLGHSGPGTAEMYRIAGMDSVFGIIPAISGDMCTRCNRIRLSATGQLYTCLGAGPALSIIDVLRSDASDDELAEAMRAAVYGKPRARGDCGRTEMWKIGG